MHRRWSSHYTSSKSVTNSLMTKANAENRNLGIKNRIGTYTEVLLPIGTSGSWRDYDVIKMSTRRQQFLVTAVCVIEDDLWLYAVDSGEEVVDVVGVAVVVVDEEGSHWRSWEQPSLQLKEKEMAQQEQPPRHIESRDKRTAQHTVWSGDREYGREVVKAVGRGGRRMKAKTVTYVRTTRVCYAVHARPVTACSRNGSQIVTRNATAEGLLLLLCCAAYSNVVTSESVLRKHRLEIME